MYEIQECSNGHWFGVQWAITYESAKNFMNLYDPNGLIPLRIVDLNSDDLHFCEKQQFNGHNWAKEGF